MLLSEHKLIYVTYIISLLFGVMIVSVVITALILVIDDGCFGYGTGGDICRLFVVV
jgi:hypothetical protein